MADGARHVEPVGPNGPVVRREAKLCGAGVLGARRREPQTPATDRQDVEAGRVVLQGPDLQPGAVGAAGTSPSWSLVVLIRGRLLSPWPRSVALLKMDDANHFLIRGRLSSPWPRSGGDGTLLARPVVRFGKNRPNREL